MSIVSVSQSAAPAFVHPIAADNGRITKPWQLLINALVNATVARNIYTLTEAITIADPGATVSIGQEVEYQFTQDATGGWAVTWDAVFKGSPSVGTGASRMSIVRFRKESQTQYVKLWESVNVVV